jgi:pyruvate dehydrogenase E1 component alpha subunit
METLNISALWRLPLVFVCENNGFSEFTPAAEVTAGRIADRARAFSVPAVEVDGNDVSEVWRAAGEAIGRARDGGGPSFIEARTYRIQGHFEAESFVLGNGRYRDNEEIEAWRRQDPIALFRDRLVAAGTAGAADLDRIEAGVLDRVADAVAYAEAGQPADPELAETLMFAPEPAGSRQRESEA